MEELLAAAAAAMNTPAAMVERSARARAQAEGASVEDVLRAWSGGGEIVATAGGGGGAQAAAPAASVTPEAAPEASGPVVDVVADAPAAAAPKAASPKAEPQDERREELVFSGGIPNWLVALFVIIPVFAVAYALFLPNGPNCGDAGRLAVDPITGEAVNCDGSQYGFDSIDFFAVGEDTYASCAACHGANGGGAGNFPAFTGGALLALFPSGECNTHVEWVRLGTTGWPDPTYGATNKAVGGSGAVMPAFGGSLTETELRSVVLYERVQFGGEDLTAALADCGLTDGGETAALGD